MRAHPVEAMSPVVAEWTGFGTGHIRKQKTEAGRQKGVLAITVKPRRNRRDWQCCGSDFSPTSGQSTPGCRTEVRLTLRYMSPIVLDGYGVHSLSQRRRCCQSCAQFFVGDAHTTTLQFLFWFPISGTPPVGLRDKTQRVSINM